MKAPRLLFLVLFFTMGAGGGVASAQEIPANLIQLLEKADESQLQLLRARFPAADANRDGALSREEAVIFARAALAGGGIKLGAVRGADAPTHTDVAYGPHARNVLDFWKAEGEGDRPLVVFIHGGGFTGGDKSKWRGAPEMKQLLENGVSCAAINYRFRRDAPIQDILHDAARAVQYLRSRAEEWQIDKEKFAGWGGSAGAGTSLWLGSRDDLADSASSDPVLRESSRLQASVLHSTQATYDLTRWESFLGPSDPDWWNSPDEMATFYHFDKLADLAKPAAAPILRECDMLAWITPDDAPVFVSNQLAGGPSRDRDHYLHHPDHAREIEKACEAAGIRCFRVGTGSDSPVTDPVEFVLAELFGEGDGIPQ
jgi:acetyl esterase